MDDLAVTVNSSAPPDLDLLRRDAQLAEDFPDPGYDNGYVFVAVGSGRPGLVITQRFSPAVAGFTPGVLVVPEQRQVFIGAGTRLLGYDARSGGWRRTWHDRTEVGFWGWQRHDDVVLMSAELELAAWSLDGSKLWTTFVEPPWTYEVDNGEVVLDVMGSVSRRRLR
ncbi:hypothetical protein [Paractinoplanes lichenicola]|uniref:Uncharacterized protein n=1 Tax=Paractinoplanes lichenicola TaxID=2802976 RepID=A0ABS1VWT2_9ACTN|nr:hypothetical protein [Actinoplanes lichenicola]MBL7258951.1 hypothetical protein [Actinoplanes lichenicola]